MDIKDKAELDAQAISDFADNITGDITAKKLRDYVLALNASLLIQKSQVVEMTVDPYVVPTSEVTENILHTTGGADRLVELPDASTVDNQTFVILTTDDSVVNVDSVSNIIGDNTFVEPAIISYRSSGGEWFAIPIYLSRKDTIELPIMFNEPGQLTAGEEMRLGNTEGQNNQGWVAPFSGKLVKASISRGDADLADVDIQVNSTVEDTLITQSVKSVHDLNIDIVEQDSIMVLGGATTPNPLTQPVVVLILRRQ